MCDFADSSSFINPLLVCLFVGMCFSNVGWSTSLISSGPLKQTWWYWSCGSRAVIWLYWSGGSDYSIYCTTHSGREALSFSRWMVLLHKLSLENDFDDSRSFELWSSAFWQRCHVPTDVNTNHIRCKSVLVIGDSHYNCSQIGSVIDRVLPLPAHHWQEKFAFKPKHSCKQCNLF